MEQATGSPIALTASKTYNVNIVPPSGNPVQGFILYNQSGYVITVSVNGNTRILPGFINDYFPVPNSLTSLTVTTSATQGDAQSASPQLYVELVWNSDPVPAGFPHANPLVVSSNVTVQSGNVNVTGTVTANLPSGTSVTVSSGTVSIGNTPNVNVASGSISISSGTVNVGSVTSITNTVAAGVSESQISNNGYSVVPGANTVTSIINPGSGPTYLYLGCLSVFNTNSAATIVEITNGAGVVYFYTSVPGNSGLAVYINALMYNSFNSSLNAWGAFVTTSQTGVRVTLTGNGSPTIHSA